MGQGQGVRRGVDVVNVTAAAAAAVGKDEDGWGGVAAGLVVAVVEAVA